MYMDKILAISTNATEILYILEGDTVKCNNGYIALPYIYLEENIQNKAINNI